MLPSTDDDDLLPDRQLPRGQVDILPTQARHLAPTRAAQGHQPPQHEQRIVAHRLQEPRQIVQIPHRDPWAHAGLTPHRLMLVIPDHRMRARTVRQPQIPGGIVANDALPSRLRQRAAQHRADPAHAARRDQPASAHDLTADRVHGPLNGLRAQLAQPEAAQVRDQIPVHDAAVVEHRRGPQPALQLGQPEVQPASHGPGPRHRLRPRQLGQFPAGPFRLGQGGEPAPTDPITATIGTGDLHREVPATMTEVRQPLAARAELLARRLVAAATPPVHPAQAIRGAHQHPLQQPGPTTSRARSAAEQT